MTARQSLPVQPLLQMYVVLVGIACGSVDHNGKPNTGVGGAGGSAAAGATAGGSGGASTGGGGASTGGGGANAAGSGGASAGSGGTSVGGATAGAMASAGAPACVFEQPMCPIGMTCDQAGATSDCFIWGTCHSTPGKVICCAGKWVEGAACL